ncbi:hypothetical protein TNCV_3773131 [Trichonephila clavipes]|nr:hypothetical protein TNCV_3773131 [Trichonephila clavipes]
MHTRGNLGLRKFCFTCVARGNRGMRSERVTTKYRLTRNNTTVPTMLRIFIHFFSYREIKIAYHVKEGRFVLGIFCSERMQVRYRSRQNDRLRVMLVLVHIDITAPHTSLHVFR